MYRSGDVASHLFPPEVAYWAYFASSDDEEVNEEDDDELYGCKCVF
jgi:hypothetical protein